MLAAAGALLAPSGHAARLAVAGPNPDTTPPGTPSAAKGGEDHPRVFARLSYPEAIKANASDGKLLVVKATAVWCGPCKMMDKTTWRDADVEKFFADKGVVISMDVDKDRASAQELKIRAMPTMVAFRNGKELDRVVGYKSAAELLAWLGEVEKGQTTATKLAGKLKAPREGDGALTMQERMELADELAGAGRTKEATEEYAWMWENMTRIEPAMAGVRSSFLASSIQRMASENPDAKARFSGMRDVVEERLKGPSKSWDDLSDWIVLNEIVGQEDKTLEWFDRIKGREDSASTLERFSYRLESLLQSRGRWADYGRMVAKPLRKLQQQQTQTQFMLRMSPPDADEQAREQMQKYARESFREFAGNLCAGLLAAGREDEARQVAAKAIEGDDTGEMRLIIVRKAIAAGVPRAEHSEMVTQAQAAHAAEADQVRGELEEALRAVK